MMRAAGLTGVMVAAAVVVSTTGRAIGEVPPNPYGVAGWSVLNQLGMPEDSLDYDWNNLRPGTLAQMCRPNHYYDVVGIPHRWWGYNQVTNEINDPDQFAQWLAANPGHVWIIGNEPDLASQDGLTREQYTHMYRTYYEFISEHDPTARFCIGAITGGSNADRLHYTKDWYEYVLNHYKNICGEPMHIDIWNIHSYVGPLQIEDPNQPIHDFVEPFIEWCHTVDGGRYAGTEVWITELPVGEWMGALSEEWIIWFAERYMPRLEQTGIDRWFWFVSRDSGEWATVALVKGSTPSPLGVAYAALANGYPNPVPPVEPFAPAPTPELFADDFSSGEIDDPWMVKAGQWAVEDGHVRQSRINFPWAGETLVLQHVYQDFDASLKMRVNAGTDPNNWAGFAFHMANRFHHHAHSGYLVFMRGNGTVGLFAAQDGSLGDAPNAVADASQWQDIRVRMVGWNIQVWVNDDLVIDHTDVNQRFPAGYSALSAWKTDSSFDDVSIERLNPVDHVFTTNEQISLGDSAFIADGAYVNSVTLTSRHADDPEAISSMRIGLNRAFPGGKDRGLLAWGHDDDDFAAWGTWDTWDAVGGGRCGLRTDAPGGAAYITPVSCETSTSGDERSVTWSFRVGPQWLEDGPLTGNYIDMLSRNASGMETRWQRSSHDPWNLTFAVEAPQKADLDYDGDVDMDDFALFQACYGGSGITPAAGCEAADLDNDGDVDAADLLIFINCMSGAGIPADPGCAG